MNYSMKMYEPVVARGIWSQISGLAILSSGVGLLSQFSPLRYFPNFPDDQSVGYLYGTTFMFDRFHRSWAAETPGKYERG